MQNADGSGAREIIASAKGRFIVIGCLLTEWDNDKFLFGGQELTYDVFSRLWRH